MTREEFIIATKELEEYYGKDLNYKQRDVWFNELQSFNVERYQRAVKILCMNSRYMPLLNEVIETVRSVPTSEEKETAEGVPCKLCKGTGYLFYKKKIGDSEYDYACLCVCKNAEGKEYKSKDGYYIKTAQEVFGDAIPKPLENLPEEKKDVKSVISDLASQMTF